MKNYKNNVKAPNGLVFIYDPEMIVDVPEDTSAGPLLYSKNCISVWCVHEHDGTVELTLTDEILHLKEKLVFEGILDTNSTNIGFQNCYGETILTIATNSERTNISVYVDSVNQATKIWCTTKSKYYQ
jgi:hypothetical protein